jgi:biopolymer transport protein ExbB
MQLLMLGVLVMLLGAPAVVWSAAKKGGDAAAEPPPLPEPPPAAEKAGGKAPSAAKTAAVRPEEPLTIEGVKQELLRQFRVGGTTNWCILFVSIFGLAFVLERLFRLRRKAIAPAGLAARADALYKEGKVDEVVRLCDGYRHSTLAKIIVFIVRHRANPIDNLNTAIGDIASRDLARHQMLTYPLATVAVLSPLLGLFGTVVGMIEAFETVAVAGTMGDPSLLANSIAKALVTTEFGLIVAMPMLFFYHMFKLRTNYLANLLEEEASGLLNEWLLKKEAARAS